MKHADMFLAKVKVKRFADSKKGQRLKDGGMGRLVVTEDNPKPDDIFTIVGVTQLNQGYTDWENDGESSFPFFVQTSRRQVYIVARSIGQRFKALPEDIDVVEERR